MADLSPVIFRTYQIICKLFFVALYCWNFGSELFHLAMESHYLNVFCAFFCHRNGHVINRTLHEWSFNMKFMKLVR